MECKLLFFLLPDIYEYCDKINISIKEKLIKVMDKIIAL